MSKRSECRNFFYDITIKSPDGKKEARLTDTLLKQCAKVDIVEAIADEKSGQGSSSLTVTFTEADFLPDQLDKTPAEGTEGRGYITNRTGALIDLRFDSEKGFTYVSPQELETGRSEDSRTQSGQSEPVSFLFSNNNIIDITWGYLEPRTSRTRRFRIGTVNYVTGAGGNSLTLQCYNLQKDLQRVKLSEGKVWTDKQGNPQSLKQVLSAIAYIFGARLEFDGQEVTAKEMESYTPPTDYKLNRTDIGGDTAISSNGNPLYLVRSYFLDEWVKDLARSYNSSYEIFEDPLVKGVPVIKFTSNLIRFKKIIRTLNYRDPDGVMLEFQYNSIAGELNKTATTSIVSEEGETSSKYIEPKLKDARDQANPATTYDPIPLVYDRRARDTIERGLYGFSLTAASVSESTVQSTAEMESRRSSFMGFITVKTIGHPDFQPDIMKIEGVGVRASTTYRFFQVAHSLSAAGYTCSMQGKTQESIDQGVKNSDRIKGNDPFATKRLSTGTDSGV